MSTDVNYAFVACSPRLGTVRETSRVTNQPIIITHYGSWIPEEDADVLTEREYPVYCPVHQKVVLKPNLVFRTPPSVQQLSEKPS